MATYSNNTTIKFVTSFTLSVSNGSSSYTVPSGHFAIVGICSALGDSGSPASVSVAGSQVVYSTTSATLDVNAQDIHVGEGGVITASSSSKSAIAKAHGAVFKNTP